MLKYLFASGVLGVLLIPVQSDPDLISVCIEDDGELRVDCRIDPKPNKINSYEFSWSAGAKETLINTNVSGSSADVRFKETSTVVELEPHGYRMTLSEFKDQPQANTTYLCKISGEIARVNIEKDQLLPCSAVSVFLRSSWTGIVCLLLFFFSTHS